jgi:hypothetical protein
VLPANEQLSGLESGGDVSSRTKQLVHWQDFRSRVMGVSGRQTAVEKAQSSYLVKFTPESSQDKVNSFQAGSAPRRHALDKHLKEGLYVDVGPSACFCMGGPLLADFALASTIPSKLREG